MLQKFFLTYGILIITVFFDFMSKNIAIESEAFIKNEGIMMSALAHLPLIIKSVYLSTIGVFLLAIYILITFYFTFKTKKFYVGASLFLAGVLGNVLDRIRFGYVVDFIQLPSLPVFNLADVFQLLGIMLMIWCWKTELDFHLPIESKRRIWGLPDRFQMVFMCQIFILFLCSSLIIFVFSYVFLKYTLIETGMAAGLPLGDILNSYVLMFITFIFLMTVLIFIIANLISRKILGPVFAIEKYLDDTLEGKTYPFKLREQDFFKVLEPKLTQINKDLKKDE